MKNYFDEISTKLNKAIAIENLIIVDNSHKHKKHKSFSPKKFHLQLKIKSLFIDGFSNITNKVYLGLFDGNIEIKVFILFFLSP